MYTLTFNLTGMTEQLAIYTTYSQQVLPDFKSKGAKGKGKAPTAAQKKLIKGMEDEKKLAERIEALVPLVEKEEQVSGFI
jgi:hypothetical protein